MPDLISFDFDLTAHEGARLAAVLDCLGSGWDPAEVLAGETEAHRMLYSDLDAEQRSAYDMLTAHGVLPDRPGWWT